jgi:predicted small lipoprotein YifL
MIPRTWLTTAGLALLLALATLAACGDDGEPATLSPDGQLTDPSSVATATPWTVPPDVIILEPEVEPTPEPGDGGNGGNGGVTPGVCGETYVVEPNDNPSLIAQKCGVDVDELMQINGIDDPTKLQIGQELILP